MSGRTWLIAVAVVAVVVVVWVVSASRDPGGTVGADQTDQPVVAAQTEGPDLGFDPSVETGLVVGDVAKLPAGAIARLNGVTTDVTLAPQSPAPDPGMELARLDVEVCAGRQPLFTDGALWVGLGADNATYSAHQGVRSFRTFTLAPGACQRGSLDLAVRNAVALTEVLLTDTTHATVARWQAQGDHAEPPPLASTTTATTQAVGAPEDVGGGGTVTLTEVASSDTRVLIAGEVCARKQALLTSPRYWYVQLTDHRLLPAERLRATTQPRRVRPGTCVHTVARFALAGEPAAVVYATDGVFEAARWRLKDPP